MKKMDWHLFWTAAAVVVSICTVVIGCFINLKNEINVVKTDIKTIKTVLILKGIMPAELAQKSEPTK